MFYKKSKKQLLLLVVGLISFTNLFSAQESDYTRVTYNQDALLIGIYDGAGYRFLPNPQGVRADEKISADKIPGKIRALFTPETKATTSFILLGGAALKSDVYNLIYHRVVRAWRNGEQYFNINLPMGIFEPYGISKLDHKEAVALNNLTEQNVNLHPTADAIVSDAYSPNNAQFKVDKTKDLSSFWTVALSGDKKHASVNYVLLIHNPELEQFFFDSLATKKNIRQIFRAALAENRAGEPETKAELKKALGLLEASSGPEEKFVVHAAAGAGAHWNPHDDSHLEKKESKDDARAYHDSDFDFAYALSLSEEKEQKNRGLSDEDALALALELSKN